jgi:hypothetical protein
MPMTQHDFFRMGFLAAGVANIAGVLTATLFFTNPLVAAQYPEVFSDFGMLAIMLWGLAYIAVANNYARVPWLLAVFALEKAAYVATWLIWYGSNGAGLGSLYEQSFVTGLFYSIYGVNDLVFGLFFTWAFMRTRQT